MSLLETHPLLGDRTRLAIMASLASAAEPLEFSTLLDSLKLSKGNLSSHARKLEDAELILVHKSFEGRKPKTTYEISAQGREELSKYLKTVESLLNKI